MPDVATVPALHRIDGLTHQLELWQNTRDHAEIGLVAPLGSGKSFGLAVKQAMLRWTNQGVDGMLVVPTFSMARMIHIPEWPAIWEQLGLHVVYESQRQAFRWPMGSRTWIRSAEIPQRLAGPNLGDVTFDEPGQMQAEAIERATVRARHAKARLRQKVFGGTPEGTGNRFAEMFADPKGNRTTIWGRTWHEDYAFYPEQLVDTYGYDESLLDTYVGAKFVPLRVGRAWRFYDPAVHKRECVYEPEAPLVLACDFNVDAMRWEVGQFVPGEIRWLDEIALGRDGSTEAAAREFVRRWGTHRHGVVVTGDAAGQARSTSGRTDYQVLREELARGSLRSVSFRVPKANPRIKDRVDNTNYHLAGRGRRVSVSEKCLELRKDWESCAWRAGTTELDDRDSLRTHSGSAADYAVWALARVVQHHPRASRPGASDIQLPDAVLDAEF